MSKIDMSKIAVMNICYQFYPFKSFLSSVTQMGIRKIDIWAGYPHLALEEGCEAEVRSVSRMCDDFGVEVICLTPKQIGLPMNIADERPKFRRRAIDYLKRAIDCSDILGTDMLQIVPGSGLYSESPQAAWERARGSIAELASYAHAAKKILVLEPLQLIESNLLGTASALKRMIDEVNSPALKAVIDTCHMEKSHETLEGCFKILGKHIRHIHLNEEDQLPWGEGRSDLDSYLTQLENSGYDGNVTLEVCSRPHYIYADWTMSKNVAYVFETLNRREYDSRRPKEA